MDVMEDEGQQNTPKRGLQEAFGENPAELCYKKICNRNPEITVHGMLEDEVDPKVLDRIMYREIYPESIIDCTTQKNYSLSWNDFEPLVLSTAQLETDTMEAFKKKVNDLLNKPMSTLTFDGTMRKWVKSSTAVDLDVNERQMIEGFLYNMGNQRGRNTIQRILEKLLASRMMTVYNCGGSNFCDEPTVRITNFQAAYHHSDISSSEEGDSPRASKRWVPDIVVEKITDIAADLSDAMVVEVKKGDIITHIHLAQLKFELIPTAIKHGQVLGMLICAKSARLLKYTLDEPRSFLKLQMSKHDFGNDTLSADFTNLLCHVKHNLDNLDQVNRCRLIEYGVIMGTMTLKKHKVAFISSPEHEVLRVTKQFGMAM